VLTLRFAPAFEVHRILASYAANAAISALRTRPVLSKALGEVSLQSLGLDRSVLL
jgi:hypothetical protein